MPMKKTKKCKFLILMICFLLSFSCITQHYIFYQNSNNVEACSDADIPDVKTTNQPRT